MTQFSFMDKFNDFGQPMAQTAVALPRRSAARTGVIGAAVGALDGDAINETRILASHVWTAFATPDPGLYLTIG